MSFYPIFLDITLKPCLVIGGGKVAERKVNGLLKAGAKVTVISPTLTKELKELARKKKIRHVPKRYKRDGLEGDQQKNPPRGRKSGKTRKRRGRPGAL
jgi:siroheme synthase-like protein